MSRILLSMTAFLVALIAAPLALADESGPDELQFRKVVEKLEKNGLTRFDVRVVYENSQWSTSAAEFEKLHKIAQSQAQIWADTILEGDYEADGQTVLDRVEEIQFKGRLVAYRITYSERAWYIGSCDYDYEDKSKLASCAEGRISEASFVSSSLTSWTRDSNAYAEFAD